MKWGGDWRERRLDIGSYVFTWNTADGVVRRMGGDFVAGNVNTDAGVIEAVRGYLLDVEARGRTASAALAELDGAT